MGKKPEISVIMSVYNPEPEGYLRQAVASIIRQTFRDWELILYDDGSKEGGAAGIRRAAGLDPRIRYLRGEENLGLAKALNICIRHAKGRYIARMDGDDISRRNRLMRQYRFLEAHPRFGWAGSCASLMDCRGVWGFQRVPAVPGRRDFLFSSPYIHPSVMFRRETLIESGGYSPRDCHRQCEDYELFMRLHSRGFRGFNLREPLLLYREERGSHRRRAWGRRLREARLRFWGFSRLGILSFGTLAYVGKPLLAALVPGPIHHQIRKRVKGNNARKRSGRKREGIPGAVKGLP